MQVHLVHLACWLIAIGVVSLELPSWVVSLLGTLPVRGPWLLLPTILLPDVFELLLHVDVHCLVVHVWRHLSLHSPWLASESSSARSLPSGLPWGVVSACKLCCTCRLLYGFILNIECAAEAAALHNTRLLKIIVTPHLAIFLLTFATTLNLVLVLISECFLSSTLALCAGWVGGKPRLAICLRFSSCRLHHLGSNDAISCGLRLCAFAEHLVWRLLCTHVT